MKSTSHRRRAGRSWRAIHHSILATMSVWPSAGLAEELVAREEPKARKGRVVEVSEARSNQLPLPPLHQILERVREEAPEVLAAKAAFRTSQASMVGAKRPSVGNPFLTVFGEHGPGVTADVFIDGQLELPVEIWRQRRRRIAESEALSTYSAASLEVARASAMASAVESYSQAVLSHERSAVLVETIDIASSQAEVYRARIELGAATARDAKVAELEVARLQVMLFESRADVEFYLGALSRLTGQRFAPPASPMPHPPWTLAGAQTDRETLPTVRESNREADYYERSKARSRQEGKAPFSVLLRAGRGDFGEGRLGGGLTFAFPFFQYNQGDVAKAAANAEQARTVADVYGKAIAAQIEATHAELQELEQAIRVLDEDAIPAAAAAVNAAVEIHRAGKSDLIPVLISRRDFASLRLRRLDLLARSWGALARIVRFKGVEP